MTQLNLLLVSAVVTVGTGQHIVDYVRFCQYECVPKQQEAGSSCLPVPPEMVGAAQTKSGNGQVLSREQAEEAAAAAEDA